MSLASERTSLGLVDSAYSTGEDFILLTLFLYLTYSALSFQLPEALVENAVGFRIRVICKDASGVLVSFWEMTGMDSCYALRDMHACQCHSLSLECCEVTNQQPI